MNNSKSTPLSFKEVKINDRFWAGRIELMAKKVIPYQWDALNDNIPGAEPSHAVENFRIAAGESAGEFHGMVFQDSDVAKWIEAASYSLVSYPNPELERIIDEVVDLIGKAQQPDGYLNTYYTVAKPDQRWKDFSGGHELYCAGHLMEAAVAYYQATGKAKFLKIMCRYADYIDSLMGPEEHKMKVYCGHEEIELALIKLYRVTCNERYLRLSQYFINERGRQPCFLTQEPTFNDSKSKWFGLDYHQAHAPVREQTKADGHSVRAMYLYTGMADLAIETVDESLYQALRKLWDNVTNYRMYITGGLGSQGHAERFTFDYDLPNDTAYAETCATIGLIFWAQRMLLLHPEGRYADVMERALYNGALSGISLDGRKYFYVNPLEVFPEAVRGRYDLQHVKPERQQWFGCACCPPKIARLITSLGQYIYSQNDEAIYTHLYIGSEAHFVIRDTGILLSQNTNYPWEGKVQFFVEPDGQTEFTIAFRVPGWCRNYQILLNGESARDVLIDKGYAKMRRLWRKGDRIELYFEMPIELIQAHPKVRQDSGKVAIQRGPLIYCLEEIDNGNNLWDISLTKHGKLSAEFSEELGGVAVIIGEALRTKNGRWGDILYHPVDEETRSVPIKAVPYYLWGNRKPGEMIVWVNRK
ncbi:MAG: glycoside hydrolase family 127 protein [Bacteroidota bacterium]